LGDAAVALVADDDRLALSCRYLSQCVLHLLAITVSLPGYPIKN
jgi:hypothetical protein